MNKNITVNELIDFLQQVPLETVVDIEVCKIESPLQTVEFKSELMPNGEIRMCLVLKGG
jgi:hypothetical protein